MCKIIRLNFLLVFFSFYTFLVFGQNPEEKYIHFKNKFEYFRSQNLDSALYYIHIAEKTPNIKERIEYLLEEGELHTDIGSLKEALKCYNSALKLATDNNYKQLEGICHKSMGYHYSITDNSIEAYQHYLFSKDIFKNLKDWDNYYKTINNLGIFLEMEGKYDKALVLYNEALEYFENKKDTSTVISININIGNIINNTKGYEEGLKVYNKLLSRKINDKDNLSLIYYNIALNNYELGHYKTSVFNIEKAIEITEQTHNKSRLIDLYAWKAEIISNLGNHKEASIYFKKALALAEKFDDLSFQISIYESMLSNQIALHQYDSIQYFLDKSFLIKDSLSERNKVIAHKQVTLQNRLEQEENINKEQKIDLSREINRKNIMLYISILGVIFTFLILFLFYFYYKNLHNELGLVKLKELQLEKQHEIEILENEKIKTELKSQKQEMLRSLLFLRKMNAEVNKVIEQINIVSDKSIITKEDINKLKKDIINRTKDQIKKVGLDTKLKTTQQKFFSDLLKQYPDLSKNELKVLAYLRIGLSSKEIAEIQNVTVEAIRKTRYRLRKKLNLESDDSLEQFLLKFH